MTNPVSTLADAIKDAFHTGTEATFYDAGTVYTFSPSGLRSWLTSTVSSLGTITATAVTATTLTSTGNQIESVTDTITAHAGGGQSLATAITTQNARVTVVATAGDSVRLPASAAGLMVLVSNRGANPMQVYGAGTDTINGIATATGISQGVNTQALYFCATAGNWDVPITSLQSTYPTALTTNGAIPAHTGHTYVITKAGVLADTLAAPTAGTDDGIEITVTSATANAHTITATGLLQTGTASVNVATFAAQPGAGLTLMAYNGKWNVIASVGITFS